MVIESAASANGSFFKLSMFVAFGMPVSLSGGELVVVIEGIVPVPVVDVIGSFFPQLLKPGIERVDKLLVGDEDHCFVVSVFRVCCDVVASGNERCPVYDEKLVVHQAPVGLHKPDVYSPFDHPFVY